MLKIPNFEQVSSNPDRPGTEDYIRANFKEQDFYNEEQIIMMPQRRNPKNMNAVAFSMVEKVDSHDKSSISQVQRKLSPSQ